MRRPHLHAVPAPPAENAAAATAPSAESPSTAPHAATPETEAEVDPVLERCLERATAPYRPHMTPVALRMLRMDLLLFLTTDPAARKLVTRVHQRLVAKSGDVTVSSREDEEDEDLGEKDGLAHGGGGRP
jgi:hypothetical protein